MQKKFRLVSIGASRLTASLLAVTALACQLSAWAVLPPTRPHQPDFDKRTPASLTTDELTQRQKGQAHLQAQAPFAACEFDSLLGSPRFIHDQHGFLTGPAGQGGAVSARTAQAIASNDPYRAVKAFLNEHSALFGHGAEALDSAKITRESVGAHNGLRTVVWHQHVDGIPVFESVLIGNISKQGELVTLASQFLPNASAKADAGLANRQSVQAAPPVQAEAAIVKAAATLGEVWSGSEFKLVSNSIGDGYVAYQTPRQAYVRKVWLPLDQHQLRLVWEVRLDLHQAPERYLVLIDAQSGEAWLRRCLTRHISPVTYNVFTMESPSPFSPGWSTPNSAQPPLTNRVLVTIDALSTNASPNGWIDDTNNTTSGNNANVFVDRNDDQQPDGPAPQGNPNRVFDFPLDLTQPPLTYSNAAVVQMFYWLNWYHDRVYDLGFTEAAGNYQENNFGRGGLGGDNIIGYVQAGADSVPPQTDNAYFMPAPEGMHGQIAMFVWDGTKPNRDGDLDSDVILHEATHGTSERLVGGGVGITALQTGGMGEGWSDFYALSLSSQASDDVDGTYPAAAYAACQLAGPFANYYFGLRHYPYCTDMAKNPFTFKDIDPAQISPHTGIPYSPLYSPFYPGEADEVHHAGEVWCATLWEARANLIKKHGYAGNQLILQLVTDGMKLSPVNPNFLQARDAILLADRVYTGGANSAELWHAFAKRGMGVSAYSPPSSTTAGLREAFDQPGIQVTDVTVLGGNGNGIIDYNECDQLQIGLQNSDSTTATHVSARLSTSTPKVMVAQPVSAYLSIPPGVTNLNLTPFKISTAPDFVCGTPVNFTLVIKCDQGSFTNTFQLPSGQAGVQTRFDNPMMYSIPDNDPAGVSSPVVVSNIVTAISKVTVSLDIIHQYDGDLRLELIAPDGTTCLLSANNGRSGRNYGTACAPETARTTFDDAAATAITAGNAPFAGSFQSQQPLAIFNGKNGTNVNGIWQLHVVDEIGGLIGIIQCWSLSIYSTACVDGGGTCPGVNLALGLVDAPDPVFLTSNLVYTITVTNFGPSISRGATVSQLLPTSSAYVSATASQGAVSFANGTLTANLGTVGIGDTATITVTVLPTITGSIYSSATVTSVEPEVDPSDNSATVTTIVNPPASDLGVGLAAAPNPALVGGVLTYSVAVTNFGPVPASGVSVPVALPASVGYSSGVASQGFVALQPGNVALCNFGALGVNRWATATIQVVPGAQGTVTATVTAVANQNDPVLNNNAASVSTVIGPAADLEVSIVDVPDPVVKQGQLSYKISIVNHGPSTASSVQLNGTLASGLTVISNYVSQGHLGITNSTLSGNLNALPNGGTVTAWVYVKPTATGTITTTANVVSPEADPNPANNSASADTIVAEPFVAIVPAGVSLRTESFTPANGAIDIGETVTMKLRLVDRGNVGATNLWATLLAGNGVTPAGNPTQLYGNFAPGDAPLEMPFSFTATGTNGGSVTATLHLTADNGYSTNVNFVFALPNLVAFANTNLIAIPDSGKADPYPSSIRVSNVNAQVTKVTATLAGLSHTYPHDVNVLLVGPSGAGTVLMAHAADRSKNLTDVTLTFDDAAPSPLPAATDLFSGLWQPTAYSAPAFPATAPVPPYPVALSGFNGVNPNGDWLLYVYDDSQGDQGQIANGWSLAFTTVAPINQPADVGLTGAVAANPIHLGDNLVCSFVVSNAGPALANSVTFSDVLPAGATLVTATNSQQTACSLKNGTLTCSLANLSSGAVARVTLVLQPTANGWLTNAVSIVGSEVDLHLSDNMLALAANVVSAYAELGVSQTLNVNPLLAGGTNATFTLTVTNAGPNAAVGVLVTNLLPPGFTFVSATPVPLTGTNGGGAVTWNLGNLDPAGVVAIVLNAAPVGLGIGTNLVTVASAGSLDTNLVNNAASLVVTNLSPVMAAGANLVFESFSPANGTVEPGERVTVSLALANAGLADLPNVVATLQVSGGVTDPSPAQPYGLLTHGGVAATRTFGFTAGTPVGGRYVATLALRNDTNDLGTVSFTFAAPSSGAFASADAIVIPDHGAASPYPAQLNVSGVTGLTSKVTVTLNGVSHAFPSDVSAVLVNPAGASVLLMSHCGGGFPVSNISFTLDDAAALALPGSTPLVDGGVYRPAAYNSAVILPGAVVAPYGGSLAALNGTSPNGIWKLYVLDDSMGDGGSIGAGWTLSITTVQTVNAVADLAVRMTASPGSVFQSSPFSYNITVVNQGPAAASGVVLTDVLPAGLSLNSVTLSQGSYTRAGSTLNLNLGSLPLGASASAMLQVTPAYTGSTVNTVQASLNEIDLNLPNNTAQTSTSVQVAPPVVLSIRPSGNQFQVVINGYAGLTYSLQTSTNLLNPNAWVPLLTNQAPADGIIQYTTTGAQSKYRYYRAVRVP
jgi:uncharacterized repeat protein (TIGR01451 family)